MKTYELDVSLGNATKRLAEREYGVPKGSIKRNWLTGQYTVEEQYASKFEQALKELQKNQQKSEEKEQSTAEQLVSLENQQDEGE